MQPLADPRTLARIASLELRARVVVEGVISGMHRSPHHGYSVEFSQHRNYTPGDEIRHIDWRVYGRSDRYHVKQFEEETNLKAHVALDVSSSMTYGSGALTKLEYASAVAAALTFLLLRQRDTVGLALFAGGVTQYLPPAGTPAHAREILRRIEQARPEPDTDVGHTLNDLAERVRRRGLIIILSDLFEDTESILTGLQHFRHRKHEVIVLHVMDPAELTLPFSDNTIFEGLENEGRLEADPRALRAEYRAAVDTHIAALRGGCRDLRTDYSLLTTERPLDEALARYLSERMRQP
jgi:uncharacterized protein (DUF58 family)